MKNLTLFKKRRDTQLNKIIFFFKNSFYFFFLYFSLFSINLPVLVIFTILNFINLLIVYFFNFFRFFELFLFKYVYSMEDMMYFN